MDSLHVWWVRLWQHLQIAKERKLKVSAGLLSLAGGIALAVAAGAPWERGVGAFIGLMGFVLIAEDIHAEKNRQDWDAWYATPESERAGYEMGRPRVTFRQRFRWWRDERRRP